MYEYFKFFDYISTVNLSSNILFGKDQDVLAPSLISISQLLLLKKLFRESNLLQRF